MPKDKVTSTAQGYGFVEFRFEHDADYAIKVCNMIQMHGKPLRVNKASSGGKQGEADIGANLFIGGLDENVDEKLLCVCRRAARRGAARRHGGPRSPAHAAPRACARGLPRSPPSPAPSRSPAPPAPSRPRPAPPGHHQARHVRRVRRRGAHP